MKTIAPAAVPAVTNGKWQPGGRLTGHGASTPMTGLSLNTQRITVPPEAGLSFSAAASPAGATGVAISIVGDNATIAPGTTIDQRTGRINVDRAQKGGSAHIEAAQTITTNMPGGGTQSRTTTYTAPFNFCAVPGSISSTSSSTRGQTGFYGGEFVHTFTSPGGGQTALERSHVNERFPAASGTSLVLNGPFGPITVVVNLPNDANAGWDLDASGAMTGPDQVTWGHTVDARPFVANASNRSPANRLPQQLTAVQNFRNLSFPSRTYGSAAVASTIHRRAIEERNNRIKAITSANATGINQEVEEDYAGPTIFRRCRATPNTVAASRPAPPGGTVPPPSTVVVAVDAEGRTATPTFTVRPPDLGVTVAANGTLTVGTTTGTVTVRAGDATHFDETTVTITAPPNSTAPTQNPAVRRP